MLHFISFIFFIYLYLFQELIKQMPTFEEPAFYRFCLQHVSQTEVLDLITSCANFQGMCALCF